MAWTRDPNLPKTTKHTCNGGNGPVFGRKTPGCPRCDELAAGATPVKWDIRDRAAEDRQRAAEIHAHYASFPTPEAHRAHCGGCCTFGEW